MTALAPMTEAGLPSFEAECTSAYAQDNVRAGRWPASGGLARAVEEFRRLLPQGLNTPGHLVYDILVHPGGQTVGLLWSAEFEVAGTRAGFVYSVHIQPARRGRGHAKASIDLIEARSLARGLGTVSLHVFSHNAAAQALYRSLGCGITGVNRLEPLQRDGA